MLFSAAGVIIQSLLKLAGGAPVGGRGGSGTD